MLRQARRILLMATRWACVGSFCLILACGDDDPPDLVIITGAIVNIDTGEPAQSVVVFPLDAPQYASEPTGQDGLFYLEVPRGSTLILVTNDFAGLDAHAAPGSTDHWLTFINFDPLLSTATDNHELIVHACPTEGSPHTWLNGGEGLGSVAIWRNFLQHSSKAPQYTNATDVTGKIIALIHVGTPANTELGVEEAQITGITTTVMDESFGKPGYWDVEHIFNGQVPGLEGVYVQDASVGPDIFVDGATASGPGVSLVTIFANQEYAASTVRLEFSDSRPERSYDFSAINPLTVPVREKATTLITLGSVDNTLAPLLEGLCAAGWVTDRCN